MSEDEMAGVSSSGSDAAVGGGAGVDVGAPEVGGAAGDTASGASGIEIRAELARRITFATHQCEVPVLADLVISNPLERDLEHVTLHLTSSPPVFGEKVWRIDRIAAGTEFTPSEQDVAIAGGLLDGLTEKMRADLRFELRERTGGAGDGDGDDGDDGEETTLATASFSIEALARNEWGGAAHMPELLAAFVMPNDPAIDRLLKRASDILERNRKLPSLEGYQSKSRKRVWEIVSALWQAVAALRPTYAEPPSSFESQGQKIRFPSVVEDSGLATCLDTTLLFAAALEQAGLYPVVVFTKGHAFAGAWLQPQHLPSLTVDDPTELRKAMADDELVLFETTGVTERPDAIAFPEALRIGAEHMAEENEHEFIYAIDIRQARGRNIKPLPGIAAAAAPEAEGAEEEADAPATPAPAPFVEAPSDLPPFDGDAVPDEEIEQPPRTPAQRLDRWQRSLLDLSKRNRLLNLRPSNTAIPILCPDPAHLEDRIASKQRIRILALEQGQGADFEQHFVEHAWEQGEVVANITNPEQLAKGTIELYRKAKADFEEGGTNTLFLALGMLRWSPPGDTKRHFRAPLILLPVRLHRRSARSTPVLAHHEDEPVFNLTLLEMLRQDFDLDMAALERELPRDESGIDVRQVWAQVRRWVRTVPRFEVVEEVVLSTFSFAKYLMWKDLTDRTATLKQNPFVHHLIDHPDAAYEGGARLLRPNRIDRRIPPSELMAPLNADASQIVAIHASGQEGDFVLEGPPGTGKSETIANIIVHNLGLGRRVLFVSEKMAALDVVYRRLSAPGIGLGDFCLELHSAKAEKKAVLRQLGSAWEHRAELDPDEWRAQAERLGELRGRLNQFVAALHAPGPAGLSPRDAIGRAVRYRDVHLLRLADWPQGGVSTDAPAPATPEAFARQKEIARRLGQQFRPLEPGDADAFAAVSATEWSHGWQARLVAEAKRLEAAIEAFIRRRREFTRKLALGDDDSDGGGGAAATYHRDESAALGDIAELVSDCAELDLGFALGGRGRDAMRALDDLLGRLEAWRGERAGLALPCSDDERIADAPVARWEEERIQAAKKVWPFRWFARNRLRREIRATLGALGGGAAAKTAPPPEDELGTLARLQTLWAEMEQLAEEIPREEGVPTPWRGLSTDVERARRAMEVGTRLREAVTRFASAGGHDLNDTRARFARVLCGEREAIEPGMPLATAARDFAAAKSEFEESFARFRTEAAVGDPLPESEEGSESDETEAPPPDADADAPAEATADDAAAPAPTAATPDDDEDENAAPDLDALARAAASVVERQTGLNRWCQWLAISREARAVGLDSLIVALEDGSVAPEQCVEAFETAYAVWAAPVMIDERPDLRRFSAIAHEDLIAKFRDLDREVAALAASHVRALLSGNTPPPDGDGAAFTQKSGYGILRHELRKQRRHKPVRQLITEMGDVVTALTPCLMMSPLSVAQFLPTDFQAFDLVVFDEASQITVPDAIGAIARGRHCIVVGDPKQMPPTNFFARGAEDDEGEERRDLESILDEALGAGVPHHRLTGHYRSRHESLICFSNHSYYESALVTYPSADTRATAVTFHRVDGVYAKGKTRTNQVEAKAVVAEIVRRLRDPELSRLSLGVVTLNSEQQRLIEDLLDDARRADPELERFFVSGEDGEGGAEEARPDPVFVKNLETVQGDERDVILLSIGYGPTLPGSREMSMNFGPLNRQGGERRLNVAITRATTEVLVFASFDSSMIDLTRTSAQAVKDLKHYLAFAERGPAALGEMLVGIGESHGYDSDFERAVAEKLRAHGWTVRTQVGVSKFRIDLGIVHPDAPGRFLAGVECDGASYHSSPSARDRDRVRHVILVERFGWRLLRVWSTDFFIDPDGAVAKLDEALRTYLEDDRAAEAAKAGQKPEPAPASEASAAVTPAPAEAPAASPAAATPEVSDTPPATTPGDSSTAPAEPTETPAPQAAVAASENMAPAPTPTVPAAVPTPAAAPIATEEPAPQATVPSPEEPAAPQATTPSSEDMSTPENNTDSSALAAADPDPDRFYEPEYQPQLRAMAVEMIDAEGPIVFARLATRIARAHGFSQTGRRIREMVQRACEGARPAVDTPDKHRVFWPEGVEPTAEVRFRGLAVNGGEPRAWSDVPHPEKLGLVREVLAATHNDEDADPARAVAERIAFRRVTEQFRAEIAALQQHLTP